MAKISNLKDKQGNVLYPITSTSALVDSNGQQFQPAKEGASYTKAEILNVIYPVGSIYLSVNDVSPQTFIGGTWTKVIDNLPLLYNKIYSNTGENVNFRGNTTGALISLRSGEAKSQGSAGNLAMWVQSGETNGWETFGYASGLHTSELKVYAWKRTS